MLNFLQRRTNDFVITTMQLRRQLLKIMIIFVKFRRTLHIKDTKNHLQSPKTKTKTQFTFNQEIDHEILILPLGS